ncbi:hypothetical protein [Saccharibacillus alkalitolerans]|uniref:Uncharacterized protein n=1 Tax=Saccharibacillus alkalitolerans TaxID=2705290 RepID=A0ABX0EZN6_9BACL|nr:hypothetical protein [Saccharibacillus alkalitolerans]NGZ74211.1 hypothetical protein [Saccharibacillus alkalitolerans]
MRTNEVNRFRNIWCILKLSNHREVETTIFGKRGYQHAAFFANRVCRLFPYWAFNASGAALAERNGDVSFSGHGHLRLGILVFGTKKQAEAAKVIIRRF